MQNRKLPTEIRRMQSLGRYSAAMTFNGAKAERTWLDLAASNHADATGLLKQLEAACRESIRQFETARAACSEIGSLLVPDPHWTP